MPVDYVGAAEIIIKAFATRYPDVALLDDGSNYSDVEFAGLLEQFFDGETIDTFIDTEFGRGVLLGMTLVYGALEGDLEESE